MTYSRKREKTRNYNGDHRDNQLQFDHSLIGEALNLGSKNVAQIAFALTNGTQEVKDLLLNECNIIYECRQCRNLFRSFANLITHKRAYCKGHQCEQMLLYDSSWYVPEKEKTKNKDDEKVPEIEVSNVKNESTRQQTISITTKTDNKTTFELKRKSLHSIVNSLQKDAQNDLQNDFPNDLVTTKEIGTSQLNTETSNQSSSSETILLTKKCSTEEDIINPSILKTSSPSDHKEVENLKDSLHQVNENSSSSKTTATSVTPTQIVRKNKPQPNLTLKFESMPNVVQKRLCPVQICTKKRHKPDIKSNGNDAHERPINLKSCIPIEVITIE